MSEPTTREEWWALLNKHWPNILKCFENAGAPMSSNSWSDGPGQDATEHPDTFIVTLEKLKQREDREMVRMLNLCWMAAPDHPSIHRWPSWGVLCDLCSEEHCLYTEEEMNT